MTNFTKRAERPRNPGNFEGEEENRLPKEGLTVLMIKTQNSEII